MISIKMIVTKAIPIDVKTSVKPNAAGIEKTSFKPGIIVKQYNALHTTTANNTLRFAKKPAWIAVCVLERAGNVCNVRHQINVENDIATPNSGEYCIPNHCAKMTAIPISTPR